MTITRTNKEQMNFKYSRYIANVGCNICPCCGEKTSSLEYIKLGKGLNKGITNLSRFENNMTVDVYICATCGAEWESEPW